MLVWFVYFSWKLNMIWVLCIYAVSLKYERTFKSYCSQYILIVSPLKFVTNVCPRRKSHSYLGTFYNTFLFQLGRWLEFIMSSTLGWICFFYCRWQKLVTNLWKIFWPLPRGIGATASSALEIVCLQEDLFYCHGKENGKSEELQKDSGFTPKTKTWCTVARQERGKRKRCMERIYLWQFLHC